jgi:hypothetical protein
MSSGPVFMFCAPGLVFGGTDGVGSRFLILGARTHFRRYRGRRVPFLMFCPHGLVFDVTEGVRSSFLFLRSQTRFRRYRGCWVSFSAVTRASGPIFIFCPPGHEGVGSRFHILRFRTQFRRYRVCRVSFSYFGRSNSFSAVPRASGPVFMFCALELVFGGTKGVGSLFHV